MIKNHQIFLISFSIYALLVSSCSHLPDIYQPSNYKDYKYRLNRIYHRSHAKLPIKSNENNAGILYLYRNSGNLLYSQCKNLPSDSHYLKLSIASGCSPIKSLYLASARTLKEHDLPISANHPPILVGERLGWVQFPKQCQ